MEPSRCPIPSFKRLTTALLLYLVFKLTSHCPFFSASNTTTTGVATTTLATSTTSLSTGKFLLGLSMEAGCAVPVPVYCLIDLALLLLLVGVLALMPFCTRRANLPAAPEGTGKSAPEAGAVLSLRIPAPPPGTHQTLITGPIHARHLTITTTSPSPSSSSPTSDELLTQLRSLRTDIHTLTAHLTRPRRRCPRPNPQGPGTPMYTFPHPHPGPGPWAASEFDPYSYGSDLDRNEPEEVWVSGPAPAARGGEDVNVNEEAEQWGPVYPYAAAEKGQEEPEEEDWSGEVEDDYEQRPEEDQTWYQLRAKVDVAAIQGWMEAAAGARARGDVEAELEGWGGPRELTERAEVEVEVPPLCFQGVSSGTRTRTGTGGSGSGEEVE